MRAVKKNKKTSGNVVQHAKETFRSRKVSSRRKTSRNVFPDEIPSWSVAMEGEGGRVGGIDGFSHHGHETFNGGAACSHVILTAVFAKWS